MNTLATSGNRAGGERPGGGSMPMLFMPALVAALIGLAMIANALDASPGLRSLLAAPAYYLLPLGVGLVLTQPFAVALTRTQRALLAYFTGLIAICAIAVAREHAGHERLSIHLVAGFVLMTALAGFALGRRVFQWNDKAREATVEFIAVLPVFAFAYALRFTVFSDYPVTDLFQATHLMKAALEFGRFDLVNRFTADSYVPVMPVIQGLMVRYLGFEPLFGTWSLAALSSVLKFLALRAVTQVLLQSRQARILAIAAMACFMSPFEPTNGDLAMLGSLLILSLAVFSVSKQSPLWRLLFVAGVAAALVLGWLSARWSPMGFLGVLAAICVFPLVIRTSEHVTAAFAVVLAIIAIVPVHRSTMAFVPLAVGCGVMFVFLNQSIRRRPAAQHGLVVATWTATMLAGSVAAGLLGWVLNHPQEDLRQLDIYKWILQSVFQRDFSQDADMLLGSGPKIALFELGRAMSPAFVALAAFAAFGAWREARRRTSGERNTSTDAAQDGVIAWAIAVTVGCFLLVGVPFVYRSGFLVIAFLAVAFGIGLSLLEGGSLVRRTAPIFLAASAAYVLGLLLAAHCIIAPQLCRKSEYLELARPYLTGLGAAVLLVALAGLLFARVIAHRQVLLLAACLVLTFSFEFALMKAYFMPYAYGPLNSHPARAVSHLSHEEIELADAVRRLGRNVALVSDPFTMSNLRALTGLNSLVTFSNLATMSPAATVRLRGWVRDVLETGHEGNCAREPPLGIIGGLAGAAELNYWLARAMSAGGGGSETLNRFGYRNSFLLTPRPDLRSADADTDHRWLAEVTARDLGGLRNTSDLWTEAPMVLLIVNRKTVAWALGDGDLSYFPDVGTLDSRLTDALARRCDTRMYGGRFVLVRFSMVSDER